MTIRYKCNECGAALNIKDELAGTQGHCPRCQVEFTVPAPDESAEADKAATVVASEQAPERKKSASGEITDDDIESFLEAGGPVSSSIDRPVALAEGSDEDDEETEEMPRKGHSKPRLDGDG